MRIVEAAQITERVRELFIRANRSLPRDVRERIRGCYEGETWPNAKDSLEKIIENFELAEQEQVPICQDTGMACVFLDIGREVHIEGDIRIAVDEGVRRACAEGRLRASVVADPVRRGPSTSGNTPAMLYIDVTGGDKITLTVAPKGFGSENMSQVKMLRPSDGEQGLVDFVTGVVEAAGPNPCPPIVVGIGVGGTFDKAALLAKKALLRPLDVPHPDPYYAGLEQKILRRINALGIGPQGFGGRTTALAAAIEVMPTHIAGFPAAVNINCHVCRHAREII
ncbi:MAG: fumarate hydratase [Treponema sp.]|jgi:fumarate hydratase subunit alpha|nr:fumarate hydratase [Treponema sp.]